jgi:tetratricopeptide (TPR) repeat protein
VLPFENISRAEDIDWLREASVNLLYLDLSRWQDIRVIDDERVADLLREVAARPGAQLSLQSALAVARRAGAGRLVMGDLLKVGSRTQVVAKIFDVRTGNRIRTVRQDASVADSILVAFGRLARGILQAEPPPGAGVGDIGTTSLEAYRAYVAGVSALNRVDLDSARIHFARAIEHDSTFALAHYKQSVVFGWISPGDPRRVSHAERANRLSTTLPPRQRALVLGQFLTGRNRWGEACDTYAELLRGDSLDVEAWYNLGECNYHDQFVDYAGGDSTRPYFRGSWNLALRAFNRALELDPSYHLAYAHIPDILLADQRVGCLRRDVVGGSCEGPFVAQLLRDSDTLVTRPAGVADVQERSRQLHQATSTAVWRTNVEQTRVSAQNWVNAGPTEARAHEALGRALLRAGRPAEAARELAAARLGHGATPDETRRNILDRLELLVKLDSVTQAAQFVDSVAPSLAGSGVFGAFLATLAGRHSRIGEIFGSGFQGPPQIRRLLESMMMAMQGAPPADLLEQETALETQLETVPEPGRTTTRTRFLLATVPWSLHLNRPVRVLDTASADPLALVIAFAVMRDTASMRRSLARLDGELAAAPRELPVATGYQIAAEAHLHLGDSATALARLRSWEERFVWLNPLAIYLPEFGNLAVPLQTWARTWLRLADLAAASGDTATATRNYRRVVGWWSGAAPVFAPHVERARAWLAAQSAR